MARAVFVGNWRAPKPSRPTIVVDAHEKAIKEYLATFGIPFSMDFGLGEPGQEEVVLHVSKTGSFVFPRVVKTGDRISVRAPDLAGHEVRVRIEWSDPT
jgi:hypothetical protein